MQVLIGMVCGSLLTWMVLRVRRMESPVVSTEIHRDATGRIDAISTYYQASSGAKVLHGTQYEWELPNRLRIEQYRDGKKLEGRWETTNP